MDLKLHIPLGDLESKENEPGFYELLSQTESKTFAFFSDNLRAYIVLRSPNNMIQEEFQTMVQLHTSIGLKVVLTATNGKEDLDPDVIVSASLGETNLIKQCTLDDGTQYVIWKYSAHIKYPHRKMINPSASIFVKLNIKSTNQSKLHNGVSAQTQAEEVLLPSNNLLAGINSGITTLSLSDPVISEDMIEENTNGLNLNKSLPSLDSATTNSLDGGLTIDRSSSSDATGYHNDFLSFQADYSIPLLSLLSMRLKSKKLISSNNCILSTLEIRSPKFTSEKKLILEICSVNLVLSNGDVEPVQHDSFPLELQSGSVLKSLYRLTNNDSTSIKLVSIQVLAKMKEKITQDSYQDISTAINTNWDTHIDFAIPGTIPRTPTTAKSYSPTKLMTPQFLGRKQDLKLSLRNASVATLKQKPKLPAFTGLSISFSGPSQVALGTVFKWKVQAINKGNASMNLSLIIQPPSDLIFEKKMPDPPSINNQMELPIFSAATLFKSYQSLKPTSHGIIALRNDISIGPLEHGAVYECELDLLAFEKGVHTLKGLKLADRVSNQIVECGRLPVIVVN